MRELRQFLRAETGTVSAVTLPSAAAVILPQAISIFKQRRPNVTLQIVEGSERSVLERVASGEAKSLFVVFFGSSSNLVVDGCR
ncbi:LysR substrate-binding domain-containing protein [Brevibacterium sp. FAM 24638]|uniref:LysR substrate-binding domain-containing protein n=1 Tax=Brevibacterium sp. FAM 24638 TaxID=3415681 RepID=UPI003C7E00F3